ncbi:MAG: glucosaminidase domain-containing protein [Holosporaceae bacterium]|nr:glucosaminidase domain-containing protein [Holosporaceae bacterium]
MVSSSSRAGVVVSDELFERDRASESEDIKNHEILRKSGFAETQYLILKGIPLTNSALKEDRVFFIKAIASTIGKVNEIVMEQRNFILSIEEKRQKRVKLAVSEVEQWKKICNFYETCDFPELLRRVAPVSISLAVAQAIIESKYGSNKVIWRLNAYFGLMKSKTTLLKFDSLFGSAIAYVKTLNVNRRYREFRKQREIMMKESGKIDGLKLVPFLKNYGVDKNYSKLVLQLIRQCKLSIFDGAK